MFNEEHATFFREAVEKAVNDALQVKLGAFYWSTAKGDGLDHAIALLDASETPRHYLINHGDAVESISHEDFLTNNRRPKNDWFTVSSIVGEATQQAKNYATDAKRPVKVLVASGDVLQK